ncbi:DUF453 domain-containing protein [Mycena indigotica]|uniref:DUF453 domain-containing protein n=1 Tax=Mycena indigotica TaxID=2126181 RepID=A0A8H6T2D9_9AGAR|nr:DUF453 domain-containing protein [Mycena indigotica]KAF7309728.1 DUF453 domain-containing protein [Mycena indigotica]
MGSPDPEHGRQLNGMGGGVSSLSKICVVSSPTPKQQQQGIQVEYTFVQVGIRDSSIDYSGNCGNLSSMIGVFARDEGLCAPPPAGASEMTVRSFNTNTSKIIDTTFPIEDDVAVLDRPEVTVAGVPGKGSEIIMEFVNPGGARTGKLLPTGTPVDTLQIAGRTLQASLVDATNPTVFVSAAELREFLAFDEYIASSSSAEATRVSEILELIRQSGAERMGLDPNAQAQPKIAILGEDGDGDADVMVHSLSMGVLHKAIPMTVGLCVGVAANIPNTLAWKIVQQKHPSKRNMVRIRHPGGSVDVGAEMNGDEAKSAKVIRTGRRLMKGVVWY